MYDEIHDKRAKASARYPVPHYIFTHLSTPPHQTEVPETQCEPHNCYQLRYPVFRFQIHFTGIRIQARVQVQKPKKKK